MCRYRIHLIALLGLSLILTCGLPTGAFAETLAERIGFPQTTWDRLMSEESIGKNPNLNRDLAYWQGDHRRIGRLQARFLLKHRNPLYQEFLYDYIDGRKNLNEVLAQLPNRFEPTELKQFKALMGRWLPRQIEELEGFAEELGMPLDAWLQILGSITANGGCTAIALAPLRTSNGHVLISYNHDFHPALDEKLLVLRRPKQGLATWGNSAAILGLYDGFNEKGLYIASNLVLSRPRKQALFFAFVIRHVLETASNTKEAVALLSRMPGRDSYNYLIADRHGDMAVVEKQWDEVSVRYPTDGTLISTNHFQSSAMIDRNEQIMPNSVWRDQRSRAYLQKRARLSETELRQWTNKPLKQGGIALDDYEAILGRIYGYTLDLNERRLTIQLDASSPLLRLSMAAWLRHPPASDETGWVQHLSAPIRAGKFDLTAFGDLDWWAAPGYGRPVLFSQLIGSANPLGVLLENRFSYRRGLENELWGAYWEAGVRQLLSPVFMRHGAYVRLASKRWFELDLGYEWMNYYRGIAEKPAGNSYLRSDPFKRLSAGDTTSFTSRSPHISLSLQGSLGAVAILNQSEFYNWSHPSNVSAFYNFETNLSHPFGAELRNTSMLLVPCGTSGWSAGLFSQWNRLPGSSGWAGFNGVQFNKLRWDGVNEGMIRLGVTSHSGNQPNAPSGLQLMFVYKHLWWR